MAQSRIQPRTPSTSRRAMEKSARQQRGIVLIFALIALVLLTMAGVGFMRAVDTNKILAGNLAFNRAAVAIADLGMEAARATANNLNPANGLWQHGGIGSGYFASIQPLAGDPANIAAFGAYPDYRQYDWTQAIPAVTADPLLNGYSIVYLIHRMCQTTGNPRVANCLNNASGGKYMGDVTNANNQGSGDPLSPMYRVTIQVTGPRQNITYAQVWMN